MKNVILLILDATKSEPLHDSGVLTVAFHSNPYISEYFGWNRGWDIFYDSVMTRAKFSERSLRI